MVHSFWFLCPYNAKVMVNFLYHNNLVEDYNDIGIINKLAQS
jgi:hypothetical protein